MGRMLETLKQGARPNADQCVVDWTLREPDDVPYIEVGAGKKVDGSSQVLAVKHPAQAAVQPPHPPTEKTLTSAQATLTITDAQPMSVLFEPWPALLVPSTGIAAEVIAFHQPKHAVSMQYAGLLGKILEGQNGPGTKIILLSGAKAGVGTTTALLNLAVVAAMQDKRRLVLVDAHLSRPTLAERLGLAVSAGLHEVLAGNVALEAAVLKTPVAGLFLMPAQGDENTAAGQVGAEALAFVFTWLKERFDLVLVDGPGIEEHSAFVPLAPLCDGTYLVVPQGEATPHRAMAQSIGRLGGRLKGLIHTQIV
jgi:Mrp family chromosome partitioning ATPase